MAPYEPRRPGFGGRLVGDRLLLVVAPRGG